ncbi:MAG: ribosome-binding factor A [Mariprofundaceae bacterium]
MRHSTPAKKRLHADMHRMLGALLQSEISDPRLSGICITRIEAKPSAHDLIVWFHRMNEDDHAACEQRLNKLAPHLMHRLRQALPRNRLPTIHFRWDKALDKGDAVLRILRDLEKSGS